MEREGAKKAKKVIPQNGAINSCLCLLRKLLQCSFFSFEKRECEPCAHKLICVHFSKIYRVITVSKAPFSDSATSCVEPQKPNSVSFGIVDGIGQQPHSTFVILFYHFSFFSCSMFFFRLLLLIDVSS